MSRSTEISILLSRFSDTSPVAATNIDWSFFGAPHGSQTDETTKFNPPEVDWSDPSASIWQRPYIRMDPNPMPLTIGATAQSYRTGLFVVDTLNPVGFAPLTAAQYADTTAVGMHRYNFSNVHCRDASGAQPLPPEKTLPNWKPFQVTIPYWVLDPSSFYYEDGYAL